MIKNLCFALQVFLATAAILGSSLAQQATQVNASSAAMDVSAAPGDTNSSQPAMATTPQFQQRTPRYRLAPSDQFDLNFELSPELNQTVTVQPDGFITLRDVGDVHVAGETVAELTETLRQAYSKTLHDPIISVVLKDFEKPYFVADGQVSKPGKYELRGVTTVTQAIAIAGGFSETSKHSQVLLFRRIDDRWTEAKILNLKKMEKKGNLSEDVSLHPGDMLFVPKNTWSKINRYIPTANLGSYLPLPPP